MKTKTQILIYCVLTAWLSIIATASAQTPILCGQTIATNTTVVTQNDQYTYSGSAGQILAFALVGWTDPNHGQWMVADIYSPSGQLVGSVDGGSSFVGHALNLALTNSGTYTILVHERLYRAASAYQLSIQSLT